MALKDRESYNAYMNEYMKKRYKRRREEALAALGGKCESCGSTKNLEIDHIDPSEKEFTLARASSYSEKRWQDELKKCQLLCHDCHVDKHRSQFPCGTPQRYWRGCRCEPCTEANSNYHKEHRTRRNTQAGNS